MREKEYNPYRTFEYSRRGVEVTNVADLLEEVGFSQEHLIWLESVDYGQRCDLAIEFYKDDAILISQIFPYGQVRNKLFGKLGYFHRDEIAENRARILLAISKIKRNFKTDAERKKFAEDMFFFSKQEVTKYHHPSDTSYSQTYRKITMAARIMGSPPIYTLFGNNPSRVMTHMAEHFKLFGYLDRLQFSLDFLETGSGLDFLKTVKPSKEVVLLFHEQILEAVKSRKDLLPIVSDHLDSDRIWSDTIKSLDMAFSSRGVAQFRQKAVDQAIIRNFAKTKALKDYLSRHPQPKGKPHTAEAVALELYSNQIVTASENLPPSERYGLLCYLYQQLSDGRVDEILTEMELDQIEFKKASDEKIIWLTQAINRARRTEHPRNPLITRGLALTSGYEVEMDYLSEFLKEKLGNDFFPVAKILGFNRGSDMFEAAPGPFYDPETGIALFEVLFDAGIANLHKEAGWTFHFNVDLEKDSDFQAVVWPFYAAGTVDTYKDYERGYDSPRNLRVYPNRQGGGPEYKEGKVFAIFEKEQFYWTYRSATHLASAAKLYRNLCKLNDVENLSQRDLVTCKGERTEKSIANRWLMFRLKMRRGLESCGLGPFSGDKNGIDGHYVRALHEQQALIYPDVASRHNPLPPTVGKAVVRLNYEEPKMVSPIPVKIDGKTWPTALHFATDTINEAVDGILRERTSFESRIIKNMEEIDHASGQYRKRLIRALFAEIHADVPAQASHRQKEAIYSEIRGLYK